MADDPFPSEPFRDLIRRIPAYGRLAWRLGSDPRLSPARRAAVLAGAAYLVSPIDLVPGIIPVLGQLDDIAVVLAALRVALDGLDPAARAAHLEAVGLQPDHLRADLGTVASTAAWIARQAARTAARVARTGAVVLGHGVARAARVGGRAGARAGRALASRRRSGREDVTEA
jgi:uncharacterized membrane protein YkvA (DUF1232 family)